jgi:hypothetical protein
MHKEDGTVNQTFGTTGRLALYLPFPYGSLKTSCFLKCYLSAFSRENVCVRTIIFWILTKK